MGGGGQASDAKVAVATSKYCTRAFDGGGGGVGGWVGGGPGLGAVRHLRCRCRYHDVKVHSVLTFGLLG